MHAAEAGTTAVLVAVVFALIELVKRFIPSKNGKADKTGEALAQLTTIATKTLAVATETLAMHKHFDEDGTPLWYVPRSWSTTQDQIVEALRDIAETQRRTVDILERVERRQ